MTRSKTKQTEINHISASEVYTMEEIALWKKVEKHTCEKHLEDINVPFWRDAKGTKTVSGHHLQICVENSAMKQHLLGRKTRAKKKE